MHGMLHEHRLNVSLVVSHHITQLILSIVVIGHLFLLVLGAINRVNWILIQSLTSWDKLLTIVHLHLGCLVCIKH